MTSSPSSPFQRRRPFAAAAVSLVTALTTSAAAAASLALLLAFSVRARSLPRAPAALRKTAKIKWSVRPFVRFPGGKAAVYFRPPSVCYVTPSLKSRSRKESVDRILALRVSLISSQPTTTPGMHAAATTAAAVAEIRRPS